MPATTHTRPGTVQINVRVAPHVLDQLTQIADQMQDAQGTRVPLVEALRRIIYNAAQRRGIVPPPPSTPTTS